MSLRRRVATLSGVAALCLSAVALTPGPAMASPSGCTVTFSGQWASSHCTSGTGNHRVIVRQIHPRPDLNPILIVGPCVPVGQTSSAYMTPWPLEAAWSAPC
jgi:hypothetical protein